MPVGIMCFKGLGLHYDDIIKLVEFSPETNVVIDHFGFFVQGIFLHKIIGCTHL
jgi:predicted TIM-barrel fold metal-dependent hydrolase